MSTNLNRLPSPTWNRSGVNVADGRFALPDALPPGAWLGPLPDGVVRLDRCASLCADLDSGTGLDAPLADAPLLALSVMEPVQTPLILRQSGAARLCAELLPGSALTAVLLLDDDAPAANLVQFHVGAGAELNLTTLRLGGDAPHWAGAALELEEDAVARLLRVELGTGPVLDGSRTVLRGDRAELTLNTLYFGAAGGPIDFNDNAVHLSRDTHSQQSCAGVLVKGGDKTYRGTIDFRRGAVHAVGHESEDVVLLDPDVKNRTVPLILCGEESVEGEHAATIGRLDEEKLFYLTSRGLTHQAAEKLMLTARFTALLDGLPVPELRQSVLDALEGRLGDA